MQERSVIAGALFLIQYFTSDKIALLLATRPALMIAAHAATASARPVV
jgi:hypothetical protein